MYKKDFTARCEKRASRYRPNGIYVHLRGWCGTFPAERFFLKFKYGN